MTLWMDYTRNVTLSFETVAACDAACKDPLLGSPAAKVPLPKGCSGPEVVEALASARKEILPDESVVAASLLSSREDTTMVGVWAAVVGAIKSTARPR